MTQILFTLVCDFDLQLRTSGNLTRYFRKFEGNEISRIAEDSEVVPN